MRSIVLITLSLFFGIFFVFIGTLKITTILHREMHREIRRNFIQYAKVFPLTDKLIGFKLSPKIYRLIVGYTEIICGLFLAFLPNSWSFKLIPNFVLILNNLLFLYTHLKLNDKFERIVPSIVFNLMLVCRLIVYYQVKYRGTKKSQYKQDTLQNELLGEEEFEESDDEKISLDKIDSEELENLLRLRKRIKRIEKYREVKDEDLINLLNKETDHFKQI